MEQDVASLPYHEPGIVVILVQTAFLLLLNIVNSFLDRVVYCGLLGQVLVGIAWGSPGARWLSTQIEEVIVQLGYLGLILLVYEGGLSTSFKSLKANLFLSSVVALTGISVPVALSFSLQGLVGATPLQAFAAGAALCSTSLGTTFTVLNSSGLSTTRLGVVLTSAAMMDDVVGLVMVQVISNLGGGGIGAVTIVRPVLVSIAFAVVVPLICYFVVMPMTALINRFRETHSHSKLTKVLNFRQTAFIIHTLLLIALVSGASYAGTSNLFAAYIAGAAISWWDTEIPHLSDKRSGKAPIQEKSGSTENTQATSSGDVKVTRDTTPVCVPETTSHEASPTSGKAVYDYYFQQPVSKILQPFFFASIGFSIPISRMFTGSIVWRGIVYAILMTLAKIVCGFWLVRTSWAPAASIQLAIGRLKPSVPHFWGRTTKMQKTPSSRQQQNQSKSTPADSSRNVQDMPDSLRSPAPTQSSSRQQHTPTKLVQTDTPVNIRNSSRSPNKPFSLHPPLILALAMTARGEIGFLISAIAKSNGVFSSSTSSAGFESEIFLIVTWAIVLCTILGPLGVGLSVRRVKALEEKKNKEEEGAGRDVLGVWGIQ